MIELTEPQVWTLIGVFATALFGMLALMSTMFVRLLDARFEGLRGEVLGGLTGLRGEMTVGIAGLRGEMTARFEKVEAQLSHLDRDVQALAKRVFPEHD